MCKSARFLLLSLLLDFTVFFCLSLRSPSQVLVAEIDLFRPKLERVKTRAEEIALTVSTQDKVKVNQTVTALCQQWENLLSLAETRELHFQEAGELWEKFEGASDALVSWSDRAQEAVSSEIVFTSLEQAQTQILEQRVLKMVEQIRNGGTMADLT